MTYASEFDFELERARRMVRKDHKQRWVYSKGGAVHITDQPIPYRDAVSVYWMPIVGCVAHTYRHAILAHPAIGSL